LALSAHDGQLNFQQWLVGCLLSRERLLELSERARGLFRSFATEICMSGAQQILDRKSVV